MLVHKAGHIRNAVVFDDNIGIDNQVVAGIQYVQNLVVGSAEAGVFGVFDHGYFIRRFIRRFAGREAFNKVDGAVARIVVYYIQAVRQAAADMPDDAADAFLYGFLVVVGNYGD